MSRTWVDLAYLIAAVLFILGLKGLTHPRTAVRGNLIGAVGMLLAVLVTLVDQQVLGAGILGYSLVFIGMAIGAGIGAWLAITIRLESMPELVALFNGLGGAASFVVAGSYVSAMTSAEIPLDTSFATALSGLIGAVTLTGSLVAFGKLAEHPLMKTLPKITNSTVTNAIVGGVTLLLMFVCAISRSNDVFFWLLVIASLGLGYCLTVSIGGADMPVVIALLNSYSGLAAAATGFVLENNVLIISGSLVGASGLILTQIMCKAMNRSLTNVLFGTLGPTGETKDADEVYQNVKATGPDEVAMLLDVARRVVIVPGYGMAVAQAQHAVRDLANHLIAKGMEVEYGIHPVAGRMPGHMNVLLAEADIPYELLKEMDEINTSMEQTDVCLVIGANDTVNPDARQPNSAIAGMPIIDADKARTCVVIKRSLSPGFAGIPNPLFAADNSLMLFADGKQAVLDILSALKEG
ncbi:MAG: NAD(P)(+) transhydrogenase (Re/Si-specific) subunit beta [Planctomycetaceae bacterium]|nr:NAD(P)(+) transhydrogenase (Re/Si-specific) subunit beta [Planctomycetaceae bacterium]